MTISIEDLEKELQGLEQDAFETEKLAAQKQDAKKQLEDLLTKRDDELKTVKGITANLQRKVEEEEEFIVNGLMKKVSTLQKEKEQLQQQESEEDIQVTKLQAQLDQLQKEKDDLQRHLYKERKFMVNKLQKQLRQATEQKASLERLLESGDSANVFQQVQTYKVAIGEAESESGNPTEFLTDSDSDSTFSEYGITAGYDATIKKLQNEVERLQELSLTKETQASNNHQKCALLRTQLEQLSQDNFLQDVKSLRLKEELLRASGERNRLLVNTEMLSENDVTQEMRLRRRESSSASVSSVSVRSRTPQQHIPSLKAHTKNILNNSGHLTSPASWVTPPVTPCLSPRSSSGTSTPTLHRGSVGGSIGTPIRCIPPRRVGSSQFPLPSDPSSVNNSFSEPSKKPPSTDHQLGKKP
eukprot:TRINITY_DN7683_c0_g2_i1.p1 TRINITY_DN7683_c0_g2~~TRINITY_DN7683_c0_g2_i1.p1  ORF type:complete len:429 (+),score=126.98 TRINITY_DN7683_c0_g2_i1:50-1288(+)